MMEMNLCVTQPFLSSFALGTEVDNVIVGDKVGVQLLYDTFGTCEPCLTGRENICDRAKITGESVDGGYAEFMKAVGAYVYLLPTNLHRVNVAPLFVQV
jgi:propanol-preferring alcohol dehydrogenase